MRAQLSWLSLALLVGWGAVFSPARAASSFRVSDLDLRDPHFLVLFIGCQDLTSTANTEIENAITMDSDSDGYLDLNLIITFDTLDPSGPGGTVRLEEGLCTSPLQTTNCGPDPLVVPTFVPYQNQPAGICLEPLSGTTRPYAPAVTTPAAPCFVTDETIVSLDILGVSIPLDRVRVAGTYVGNPPTAITDGLMSGFISETVAESVVFPVSLPVIGGLSLAEVFPGGSGNCAAYSDMDTDGSTPGWWLYFNFTADLVSFTLPVETTTWGAIKAIYR